ncbi:hypothetical protein RsS62_39530 [Rhizobium dioscoreae]|nr:hypothetical protein RsS62_39530 [Rhizobium dioscoreae]
MNNCDGGFKRVRCTKITSQNCHTADTLAAGNYFRLLERDAQPRVDRAEKEHRALSRLNSNCRYSQIKKAQLFAGLSIIVVNNLK